MAKNGVLVALSAMAETVHSKNRSVVCEQDVQDGQVFRLDSMSTDADKPEVFVATQPEVGKLNGLWMAYGFAQVRSKLSDTVTLTNEIADPRAYINNAGFVFDAFKPEKDDILQMTAECFTGNFQQASTKYANAEANSMSLKWGTTQTDNALSVKYLKTTYISIGTGSLADLGRVPAYMVEVVAN